MHTARRDGTWLRRTIPALAVVLAVAGLGACGGSTTESQHRSPGASPSPGSTKGPGDQADTSTRGANTSPGATGPSEATDAPSENPGDALHRKAAKRVASMSAQEKAGQVLMVGIPLNADESTLGSWSATLRRAQVGNVFLAGRWQSGVSGLRPRVDALTQASTVSGLKPWVAVDQEGGPVRSLKGPGFSSIPAAVTQGTWNDQELRSKAKTWGQEMAAAGVNMDFAPVSDTVPAGTAKRNPPIGAFGRQYGSDPAAVSRSAQAFAQGLDRGGVTPVLKHFPGLGLVTANTDTAAVVTDARTSASGLEVRGFRDQIRNGAPWVMMSSAVYPRLDPDSPAVFSDSVVTGLLKKNLGFDGAVVSDDLCGAKSVSSVPLGQRAQRFLAAGGDLFLCSAATPSRVSELSRSISQQAGKEPALAAALDRAATKVVESKLHQ